MVAWSASSPRLPRAPRGRAPPRPARRCLDVGQLREHGRTLVPLPGSCPPPARAAPLPGRCHLRGRCMSAATNRRRRASSRLEAGVSRSACSASSAAVGRRAPARAPFGPLPRARKRRRRRARPWRVRGDGLVPLAEDTISASRALSRRRRAGVSCPATAVASSGCVNRSRRPSRSRIPASSASGEPTVEPGAHRGLDKGDGRIGERCDRARNHERCGAEAVDARMQELIEVGRESGAPRRAQACRLFAGARLRARARRRDCLARSPRA